MNDSSSLYVNTLPSYGILKVKAPQSNSPLYEVWWPYALW